jgi:hypothetical protein
MPTFLLHIKADLENIAKIEVLPDHRYCVDVSCLGCVLLLRRRLDC